MISIVCPFFNEKENLKELYYRLLKVAGEFSEPYEIIFVDDGSTDDGGDELKPLMKGNGSTCLIEFDRNYGLTTALYAGLQAAKGDTLAYLDADLQNPPEEFPRLLELLKESDMVLGIRAKRQDTWLKKISSKIANGFRKMVLKDSIIDTACSLRVFRRPVLRAFYPYQGMHRFFAVLAEAQGFRITQVPVSHHRRLKGKAKYGLRNRFWGPLWDLFSIQWLLKREINYRIRNMNYGS